MPKIFPTRNASSVINKACVLGLQHCERKIFFPEKFTDIADGNYVTGLVDGEGCFKVSLKYRRGRWNFNPRFEVGMRLDEQAIIRWLKIYFRCGEVNEDRQRSSPSIRFTVSNLYDLLSKVVPHFETFPLRAKKRADYLIWLKMLQLQAQFFRRPWPDTVREQMTAYYEELKDGRLLKMEI